MTLSEQLADCRTGIDCDAGAMAWEAMGQLDLPTRQAINHRRYEILKTGERLAVPKKRG